MAERNAKGLLRSKEFMKNHAEQAPEKASGLHHLRVYPASVEGHVKVTHHAGADAKAHASHEFGPEQHDELAAHLMEHAGMPYDSEGGGEHYADEGDERGGEAAAERA